MFQKILFVALLVCCSIGCTIEAPENDDEESIALTPAVPTPPVVPVEAECPPEFHGEFISGELNRSGSEFDRKVINQNTRIYYYTLNLRLNDSTSINVVLKEAVLGLFIQRDGIKAAKTETQIEDEDLLLVRLDHLVEPGTWKGVLIKNLTRNISFEEE